MSKNKITDIKGRMVFDSRGKPTIEAEVIVNNKISGIAIAPSGASKGYNEAIEKKDKKKHFYGEGVTENIKLINSIIRKALLGQEIENQKKIDNILINLDGTENKSFLGGNTTIAVSMAVLRCASKSNKKPLWSYLNPKNKKLPIPEIQIIGGGKHAKGSIPIQDFMVIPNGAPDFYTALEWVYRIYKIAGDKLLKDGKLLGVADEGGYWPNFKDIEETLTFLSKCIEEAGLEFFKEVSISLDIAANNLKKEKGYMLFKNNKPYSKKQFKKKLLQIINNYPIISIEDPFDELDLDQYKEFKSEAPSYLQIVGDDLVVTNTKLIKMANNNNAINTVLIKPNQIGTISETIKAINLSKKLKLFTIISARSGETEDSIISDLSVGWDIKQLKVGSMSRSERLSKWNQCLRIGEKLENNYAMHQPPSIWKSF